MRPDADRSMSDLSDLISDLHSKLRDAGLSAQATDFVERANHLAHKQGNLTVWLSEWLKDNAGMLADVGLSKVGRDLKNLVSEMQTDFAERTRGYWDETESGDTREDQTSEERRARDVDECWEHKWVGGDGDFVLKDGSPLTEEQAAESEEPVLYVAYSQCVLCGITRSATYKQPEGMEPDDTDVNQWELVGEYLEDSHDESSTGRLE